MSSPHFLVVCFPIQSHINPGLQFAKRLLQNGATVTFVTCESAYRRMIIRGPIPEGLTFGTISDGYDDGYEKKDGNDSVNSYVSKVKQHGAETLKELIHRCANEGRTVDHIVYTIMLTWAGKVARSLNLPYTCLWIQPSTLLDIYYYYFNGYGDVMKGYREDDPSWSLELPNLPFQIKFNELPSFIAPSNPYKFALLELQEQFEMYEAEEQKPTILINTFDALEPHALKAIEKYNLVGVGPLLPSAFLDGSDQSDTCFGAELFKRPKDYMKWLDSNPESSVVYVSFGSISELPKKQMQEVASALLECKRPFLWVIRHKDPKKNAQDQVEEEDKLDGMEDLEQKGLVVPWCSQVEVLSHPSVGCFVTHCGWNSSLESLASGVPMVGIPQWSDQPTNAKLIEDVWRTGVRAKPNKLEENTVESQEIVRCLNIFLEDEDLWRNAKKWRELAIEALQEGGSSDKKLKAFVQEAAGTRAAPQAE